MNTLDTLTIAQLQAWMQMAQQRAIAGRVADWIPSLAAADPQGFAAFVYGSSRGVGGGDTNWAFPLMSTVKPLLLLYVLEQVGIATVLDWVGVVPSDAPFNSIAQLKADGGRPRNPMINSGAIALADKLPGRDASDRCRRFCDWLNRQAGCQFSLDAGVLAAVRSTSREPNRSLAALLAESGQIGDAAIALDTYEQVCCLSGRVADLAAAGLLLARGQERRQHRRFVNGVMLTCGLYEASALVAVRIGLPMKSGISGALLTVVPGQGAIACYSPMLDRAGNPIVGLLLVEVMTEALELSGLD